MKNFRDYLKNMSLIQVVSALASVLLCGCAHYYYIPKAHNVPLFTEKNDFRFCISTGFEDNSSSTDIQAAYAVTKNLGIMTDFMFSNGGYFYERNVAKLTYFDGAIGYFKPFGEFWVFETYAGLGTSSQRHEYYSGDYQGKSLLKFSKTFFQPSLGITLNAFDIALTTGFSRMNFTRVENSATPGSAYYNDLEMINQDRISTLFEPAFTVRAGWKAVKAQLQYVYTFNLTNPDLPFEYSKVSLGIYVSLSKKYLSQAKSE